MKDDAHLLREYVDHQGTAAFSEMVHRHLDLVYSVALRQVAGDTHRAEDVSQQVFCELARKARTLLNRPSLAGWLYTTARHIGARNQRAEQRRLNREQSALVHDPRPHPRSRRTGMGGIATPDRRSLDLTSRRK